MRCAGRCSPGLHQAFGLGGRRSAVPSCTRSSRGVAARPVSNSVSIGGSGPVWSRTPLGAPVLRDQGPIGRPGTARPMQVSTKRHPAQNALFRQAAPIRETPWPVSGLGLTVEAMDNRSPILRFGILSDGKRSSYWRVRAGVARPELFLEREGFGKQWHLSLHESGRWHLKEGGQERISWARPDEVVPGYTRAVGIVQPVAVAHRDDAAPEGVELVLVPPEAEPTTFSVFMERPGANMNGWPGKNAMGTAFVGRIPLAGDAGTCCIVARQEPLAPGQVTLPRPSDAELARMREVAGRGTLLATVVGSLGDGAIALIDLRAARNVHAPVDPEGVRRPGG
jgi:hypothetical protein